MCISNFIEQQLLGVRERLARRITTIVKENGGHIDSHFMDDETITEYPPVVVSKDSNGYNRYGGYEAATLVSIFLREDILYCMLNGEAGENFEQPMSSIQIEGLLEILKWFKESEIPIVDEEEILVCNECGSMDIQE